MEGDIYPGLGDGTQIDNKVMQTFQKSFVQVQNILDQNRLLINEINQNHESKVPDNLSRNVELIRELNNNIRRVVDLYADLSTNFTKSVNASSEGDSSGGALRSDCNLSGGGHKRGRPSVVGVRGPFIAYFSLNTNHNFLLDFTRETKEKYIVGNTVSSHILMKQTLSAEVFYIANFDKSICIDDLRQSRKKSALEITLSSAPQEQNLR